MNFGTIIGIVMSLMSKRQEIAEIIKGGIELFAKLQKMWPEIAPAVAEITAQAGVQPATESKYSVTWLQESLNKLINAGLTVDGDYGEATRAAVKKFQEAHGLVADGWCGGATQLAIADALK